MPRPTCHFSAPPVRRSRATRPAFALVVVLLFSITATAALTIFINQQAVATAQTNKQVQAYANHHAAAGIREFVTKWMSNLQERSVIDALDDDGRAFTIQIRSAGEVDVFMAPVQGLVLRRTDALDLDARVLAESLIDELNAIAGVERSFDGTPITTDPLTRPLMRERGPLHISVNDAPELVLRAALRVLYPEFNADSIALDFIATRASTPITPAQVFKILGDAGLTDDEASRFDLLLTTDPVLWRVAAIWTEDKGAFPSWQGDLVLNPEGSMWDKSSPFLTWGPIPNE